MLEAQMLHDAQSIQPLHSLHSKASELEQCPESLMEQWSLRSFISSNVLNAVAAGLLGTRRNGSRGGTHRRPPVGHPALHSYERMGGCSPPPQT